MISDQSPYPARIVIEGGDATTLSRLVAVEHRLAHDPPFGQGRIELARAAHVVLLTVPVRGDPVAARRDPRDPRAPLPVTSGRVRGHGCADPRRRCDGRNAEYFDASTGSTPYVLGFVFALSLVLLTIAFRSLVVALVSIVLNLSPSAPPTGC